MLNELTLAQRKLADFMSDLSEKCYSANWIESLEYVLWDTLTNGERKFGHDIISPQDVNLLRQHSNDCNCWIYWDNETEETSIDFALWKQKFDFLVSQKPDILKA